MKRLVFCTLLLASAGARADSCSATISELNFGAVSPLASGDVTASASGTVSCSWNLLSNLPPYLLLLPKVSVCVSIGLGGSSTTTLPRTLGNGAQRIGYNLYRDASYQPAAIFGSAATPATPTPWTVVLAAPNLLTGGTFVYPFTVYGRIPAGALAGIATVGNNDTEFSEDFAGRATVSYAFFNLVQPACGAGTTSAIGFNVKARIVNDCRISATPIDFGSRGVLNQAVRQSGSLSVRCVNNNAYQIALSGGGSGMPAAREMRSTAGGRLNYVLSASLDGSSWGDGSAGSAVVSGVGNGGTSVIPIYGLVPAQATPAPGDYRDTVTATVYF